MASFSRLIFHLLALCIFLILAVLGGWQFYRLQEKKALIARMEARLNAPPLPFPALSQWEQFPFQDYTPVRLQGTYVQGPENVAFLFRAYQETGRAGYFILSPFRLTAGGVVIIARGFIPQEKREDFLKSLPASSPPVKEEEIVGLMRLPESHYFFTPPDDPQKKEFFTLDPFPLSSVFSLNFKEVAPVWVDLKPEDPASLAIKLQPGLSHLQLPNSHLGYAITWWSLALIWGGIWWVKRRRT